MERCRITSKSMSRRRLLHRGGTALVVSIALAGCTEDVGEELPANKHWPSTELAPNLPVREQSEILERRIEEVSGPSITDIEDFVTVLDDRGIEFESVTEVVGMLHVEYIETDIRRRGILNVTGMIAGAYAALVIEGFDGRGLELVVFGADGSTIGIIEIATRWAVEFNKGVLSAAEYGELVAGTIETKRTPPQHDIAPDE